MSKKPIALNIEQGATYTGSIVWTDSNRVPRNLTGYSARMQIRKDYSANAAIILELTTENGRLILTPSEGRIDMIIDAEDTETIPVIRSGNSKPPKSTYVYDIEVVDPSRHVTRLALGDVNVFAEVTRD